ncbi:Tad domain-containing protein [Thermaerobacter marianensis]|uniref:Tad domain-containing protein n=1 Tax=Thermaerobacter marianensis TaxID=73919 RepID=UPI0002DD8074|nr:pilus assembly protein TadG-related protein [Thermaerobacter marianensis]
MAAAFVLVLPVLLAAVGLGLDAGRLVVVRAHAQAVADLAGLAAVQEIDEDAFARGEPALREAAAAATARQWAEDGLRRAFGDAVAEDATVDVVVVNASPASPRRHPWSGRRVAEPTVGVRLVVPVRLGWLPAVAAIPLTVTADASVAVERQTAASRP